METPSYLFNNILRNDVLCGYLMLYNTVPMYNVVSIFFLFCFFCYPFDYNYDYYYLYCIFFLSLASNLKINKKSFKGVGGGPEKKKKKKKEKKITH